MKLAVLHDFDANATSKVTPKAFAAFVAAAERYSRPAAPEARGAVLAAKDTVRDVLHAADYEVFFTSGGTAADALVFRGAQHLFGAQLRLATGALEHAAIRDLVAQGQAAGNWQHTPLAATAAGIVAPPTGAGDVATQIAVDSAAPPAFGGAASPSDVAAGAAVSASAAAADLYSVMLAHNETGALQPVAAWAAYAHARGALCHTDAVQAVGRLPVDTNALGVDALSLAGHKVGAVGGVGALLVHRRSRLVRAVAQVAPHYGDDNVAGILSLQAALLHLPDAAARQRIQTLRDTFEQTVRQALGPEGCRVLAGEGPRLGNTSCLHVPNVAAEGLLMALDLAGFAISAGAACASGALEPSPSLLAMGLGDVAAREVVRISWPYDATAEASAAMTQALLAAVARSRSGVR